MEAILEFVIFVGFIYWAFPSFFSLGVSRVNKMVDVVTNRMFDIFNHFSPRENHQTDTLSTLSALRRFSKERQLNRKSLYRGDEAKERESRLFDIKENAAEAEIPLKRPLMGLSCEFCTATSRESLVNKTTERFALNNILDHTPTNRNHTFLQRTFSHLNQVFKLEKFDYPQVADIVLKDERLKRAIEKTALQQFQDSDRDDDDFYQELIKNNGKRAKKLLYDMRSTLSHHLLRFTSWVLYKLLPCFLSCVVAHPGQIHMLKQAGTTKLPLIFLPLHRSHLDYILISFILLNNNVRSPLVAAGDNLRIPFFGSLLRGLGAFFIKRRIDPIMGRKDHLYKTVLHTYMNECLRAGHNIEFFLEGGRTRTGKPCMPKYGILSVIVEAFMDGTIEDALLVPVSVNYEKLVDGNFVREQLGQPKEMETFGAAIKGIWHVLNSDYGMMRIDFNQPFSLKELVKTFNTTGQDLCDGVKKTLKSNPSTSSLYGTDIVSDEHKSLVESLSKHIIYDCAKSTSVMSTNALAYLLLTKFRRGATVETLVNELDDLKKELEFARKDIGFTGDSIDVINYAVDMLGPGLVRKEKVNGMDVIKPMACLPNVIELTYYSNTVVTHFALESIIAIAIKSVANQSGYVQHSDLYDTVHDLCDIFQYEFIFCKPCQNLDHVIMRCVDDLTLRHNIFTVDEHESERVKMSKRMAREFEGESDDEPVSKPYVLNSANSDAVDYLNYLQGILMPLVETYATTAFTMGKLVKRSLLENELVEEVLKEIKVQLQNGDLQYDESVSVDPVKNAFKVFQKWDVLECHAEKRLRLYYLKETQDNTQAMKSLHERIDKYKWTVRSD